MLVPEVLLLQLATLPVPLAHARAQRFQPGSRVARRGWAQRFVTHPRAPGFLEPHLCVKVRTTLQLLVMSSPPDSARRARSGSGDGVSGSWQSGSP